MSRRFILIFSAIVLTVFVNNLKAQAPTISYTPSTNAYPLGVTITNLTPTVTGTVPATTFSAVSTFVASSTSIQDPRGLCADASGNIYEADYTGNKIYKISSAGGTPTLIAGSGATSESNNTTGTLAAFNRPTGVATDGTYLYVVDNGGSTIRKITLSGLYPVTTIVSSGLSSPTGIDYDGAGNLYITDSGNNLIKKLVISTSTVTTIAGSSSGELDNSSGTSAKFKSPAGIVYDGSANLYVCDFTGHTVRKISTTSPYKVTTVAGTGTAGSVNSPGTPSFNSPYGITMDALGILYVADEGNSEIRMVTTAGYVTALAGVAGSAAELDGVGTAAKFNAPYCIDADKLGNLFVGDDIGTNSTVRKVLLTGYIISPTALPTGLSFDGTTGYISGMPTATQSATVYTITAYNSSGSNSTTVTISTFLNAPAISYSPASNNYVVGTAISTLSPANSGGVVGSPGYGSGAVIATGVSGADAMAVDASGNVYVTDYNAGKINEYTSSGSFIGNFGTGVTMGAPASIVFDSQNNCYVLDKTKQCVFKFNSSGTYQSTIISSLSTNCYGFAIDASDFIYIADYANNTIKKYNTSGTYQSFSIATGTSTTPSGVAVDAAGNIYSLNFGTGKVAKYNAAGTLVNASLISGLNGPWAFALDGGGNIYVGDSLNQLVKIYNSSGTLLTSISGFSQPDGLVVDASGNLYVSDYNTNTVYKFPPTGGYYISDVLPPGLSFDIPTGNITGTPTTSFPATTYTVTAYNAAGNNSTTVTISCAAVYTWVGNSGSNYNWSTAANWSPASVPGSSDQALIGSTANFIQPPVVTSAAQVGSIILGTNATAASGITVNSALQVNGAITYQSDSHSYQTFTATLSGTGSITATGLNIIANTTLAGHPYTETLASSVSLLSINGNVALTSSKVSADVFNSTFNITGGIVTVSGALQTTNTAGSTSTFAVVPTTSATLKLSNAAALSGLSSLGTNTITFKNTGATVEYSGTAQTVYTDAAITGLPLGVSYQNITFSGSGIKTASSGNLNVAGDFTNSYTTINGTNYLNFSSPTVAFNGTTQSLAGGSGLGTTFYKTTFSGAGTKSMASGNFYIGNTGVLTMSGTNVLTVLAVGASSSLTLVSDTSGTATVAAISNTAIAPAAANGPTITGNVTAQRFVSGGATYTAGRYVYRNYRLMTSPVNEGKDGNGNYPYSLNYLAASTIITDCTSTYGAVGGNPSLYLYNENYTPSSSSFTSGNFIGITNISSTVPSGHLTTTDASVSTPKIYVGDGYMMYFRGDKTTHLSKKTTYPYVGPESVTFSTTGALNQGTYNVVSWTGYGGLLYTNGNAGNSNVRGFNLVGNPYASSIDFSLFSSTNTNAPVYGPNVRAKIWILNPKTNNYDTYSFTEGVAGSDATTGIGSNVIPSGQGFFVRSSGHSSALTFRETAKITQQVIGPNSLLGTPVTQSAIQGFMRLKLVTDSVNNDDIVIGFNRTATTTFNENADAEFIPGNGSPESLASLSSDNVKVSIKWLPLPNAATKQVIKLFARASASGTYTMERSDLKAIPQIYDIWLMDNYKKDSLDIRNNTTYAFNIKVTDTASFGSNRFSIVIRQNPQLGVHLLNFNAVKATTGVQVIWKTENEQNYTNFTVERSINKGVTFDAIGGFNANAQATYTLADKTPYPGTNQYRLKMEDLNGVITYSKVVTLMYTNSVNNIAINNILVYPNPSKGMLNLNIVQNDANTAPLSQMASGPITIQPASGVTSKVYSIKIVNSTGAVIKSTTTSQPNWQADLSNLTPGTYVIQVVNNNDKSLVGKSAFIKL